MANVNSPQGFRASQHAGGGRAQRNKRYHIASAYNANIAQGDVVIPTTTSKNITRPGSGTVKLQGVFAGCFYLDPNQADPQYNKLWPANQVIMTNTQADAYVYDDPAIIFEAQVDNAFAVTNIGFLADLTLGTANLLVKQSADSIASSTIGSGTTVKILDVVNRPDNILGQYAKVLCQISNHYNGPTLTAA